MNKYTENEKSIVIARYGNGESVADLVRDMQIPRSTIYAWIKEATAGESNKKTVSLKNYRLLENKVIRLQGIIWMFQEEHSTTTFSVINERTHGTPSAGRNSDLRFNAFTTTAARYSAPQKSAP